MSTNFLWTDGCWIRACTRRGGFTSCQEDLAAKNPFLGFANPLGFATFFLLFCWLIFLLLFHQHEYLSKFWSEPLSLLSKSLLWKSLTFARPFCHWFPNWLSVPHSLLSSRLLSSCHSRSLKPSTPPEHPPALQPTQSPLYMLPLPADSLLKSWAPWQMASRPCVCGFPSRHPCTMTWLWPHYHLLEGYGSCPYSFPTHLSLELDSKM